MRSKGENMTECWHVLCVARAGWWTWLMSFASLETALARAAKWQDQEDGTLSIVCQGPEGDLPLICH